MKQNTHTITLAKRRDGNYTVYHTGHIGFSITKSYQQYNKQVGKIIYDAIFDEYKFIPSIWFLMFWTVTQTKEMTDILTRLNKGERL
jgi:hypothetical protein